MTAIIELTSLIIIEFVFAFFFGAFRKMNTKNKRIYLFVALLPLALMTMFHSPAIGNDTKNYIDLFNQVKHQSLSAIFKNTRFEKGYLLYNFLLGKLFQSPQALFICTGAFLYLSLSRWLKKWCDAPGLFVCLLVEMLVIDGWINTQRQTMVAAILFFAFDFLMERKPIKFALITLLASSFHNVSLVFLLAYPAVYFLKRKENAGILGKYRFEIVAFLACLLVGFFFTPLLSLLVRIFPRYAYYINGLYMNGEARLAIILKIVVYGLMLLLPRALEKRKSDESGLKIILYRFSIINMVFMVGANKATILMRFAGLFSTYAILEYTNCVARLKCKSNRQVVTAISLILFAIYGVTITVLRTPAWQTTYPFEWFWS